MFKLQRLEITGFKSFADYTELVFTGNGITAIVGPNGCGKSNVADAIAWVLGEQKVKNLRGGEMKDVIFQGSKNRLPSGMAEVVLHMVRDENVEEEPDIDDIDATLEELDDQAEAVEERLAPELAAEAATTQADAEAKVSAPNGGAHVAVVEASSVDVSVANDSATEPIVSADNVPASADASLSAGASLFDGAAAVETPAPAKSEATNVEAAIGEGPAAAEGVAALVAAKSRAQHQHKRHWRPRRLALDFAPGETVSVTRRLYRDGDSEYLLNGRVCRLRDIQDLFSGTGLSGAHYAIIEQGRIGQILSAKPMDRRTIVEEAAGITKFRVRQRAAEARLEAARTNLSRVSDIISEIERQVGSLRRQAAKARRYHQIRDELRDLLRRVYAADERALTSHLADLA
ncbi:MAG: AAA family ATPase, partial [Acidobacteriota bacterium]|nr:AAA family ATPase [Acidobacteriota bacterium]